MDHASTECLGIHGARRGRRSGATSGGRPWEPGARFEALEPLRQGVRFAFGAVSQDIASGLKLRHDHGSQSVADDFQRELAFLGIASSPAFVRESEGKGCVERFIRTLKEKFGGDLRWPWVRPPGVEVGAARHRRSVV